VAAKQPRCPHLFLYGERDVLVPPRDVRAWIDKQRAMGIDTESHAFADARHVALFPKDPGRYRALLTEFLKRVIP
jgi:pimeloyl-ACP methyl ester carboxylesterase